MSTYQSDSISLYTPSPPPPPPPACVSRDDYSAADAARQRLAAKPRFNLSLPNLRSSPKKGKEPVADVSIAASQPGHPNLISLDSSSLDTTEEYTDKYEWAIVYENQRGMTMFSIPYYSRLSLLPSDPSPFTIPNASTKRSEQLSVTLADYPLPDGSWRWVSKCWMIDMRSDSGEVQHDGFEYNWMFRTHKWRAEVGSLSAGGWVRRRRWVRLMMRPAKHRHRRHGEGNGGQSTPTTTTGSSFTGLLSPAGHRHSVGSSLLPPSIKSLNADNLDDVTDIADIWLKDDVEDNWAKCRILMKRLGRDGRILEMWKLWLPSHPDHQHAFEMMARSGKLRQQQWTEDDLPSLSEAVIEEDISSDSLSQLRIPPREYLIPVLRAHGSSLLQSFIYPDSRAKFLTMLGMAGLLPELNIGLGIGWGASEMDFWSYASGLANKFPVLKRNEEKHV